MLFRGLSVVVDRHRVVVMGDAGQVATARWDGRRLTERSGPLDGWEELEERITRDEADAIRAAAEGSVDEAGVDLTLIDWMLALTPTERLHFLRNHAATLAPFVHGDDADATQ